MAIFTQNNILLGSVATHLRYGRIFSNHFITNLLMSLPAKNFFENRLRFDGVTVMSLVSSFFGTLLPCCYLNFCIFGRLSVCFKKAFS